jgi:hypothetical protein
MTNAVSERYVGIEQRRADEERIRGRDRIVRDRDLRIAEYVTVQTDQPANQDRQNQNRHQRLDYIRDTERQISDTWHRLEESRAQDAEFLVRLGISRGNQALNTEQAAIAYLQRRGRHVLTEEEIEQLINTGVQHRMEQQQAQQAQQQAQQR